MLDKLINTRHVRLFYEVSLQGFIPERSIIKDSDSMRYMVDQWEKHRAAGTDLAKIPDFVDYSRPTYYRAKKLLSDLDPGITPPSKARVRRNRSTWGESEKQRVLQIRRANPTYGKAKIAVILTRDFGLRISESTVGRILTHLMKKHLITRSASATRSRKQRHFNNSHAKRWCYKNYASIDVGKRIQVDHMSARKNDIRVKHFQA